MISKQASKQASKNSPNSEGSNNNSSGNNDRGERVLLSRGRDGNPLRLGERKLVRLGDVAEVKFGIKTGANEFFYLEDKTDNDMKFAEIKLLIKNLGSFKDLIEIKKAGLRICRNSGTGDYWLIEKEFLRPVIKSPRDCRSILIDTKVLQLRAFICNKTKVELKNSSVLKYIEAGEKAEIEIRQGSGKGMKVKGYQSLESIKARKYWWQIDEQCGNIFWGKEIRERLATFTSNDLIAADCRLYYAKVDLPIKLLCNSTMYYFLGEVLKRDLGGGGGPRSLMVYEVQDSLIMNPSLFEEKQWEGFDKFLDREVKNIFDECGLKREEKIREQNPNPLPDRKRLDDIVFDAIDLTVDERKEVYWSVCELVKNRLDKAGSL